jgi:hypothetical protein
LKNQTNLKTKQQTFLSLSLLDSEGDADERDSVRAEHSGARRRTNSKL